jgi:hypothetical protein
MSRTRLFGPVRNLSPGTKAWLVVVSTQDAAPEGNTWTVPGGLIARIRISPSQSADATTGAAKDETAMSKAVKIVQVWLFRAMCIHRILVVFAG